MTRPVFYMPDTWLAAHIYRSEDADHHRGITNTGAFMSQHRHLIDEHWSVDKKNSMAAHIDSFHTPTEGPGWPMAN